MSKASPKRRSRAEVSTPLTLPLDDIELYDRDPRQSPNAEYTRIKASIQAQGIDQPLVVTRRPDAERYVIAAGGNTRLKILRELFEETGKARYARVACVAKPWRGEAEVVLAHLRENDLRGGLNFVDKARAVREVRQLIEQEEGQVSLTLAALTEVLKARGYPMSRTSLWFMEYVVDVLAARLPAALRAGLGRDEVERIRGFERAARALWHDRLPADSDDFDEVFTLLCRRYDSSDWDYLSLRQALEAEIAERLNQTVHAVRLALDARLHGVAETVLPARDEGDDGWPELIQPKPRLTSERVVSVAAPDAGADPNEATASSDQPLTDLPTPQETPDPQPTPLGDPTPKTLAVTVPARPLSQLRAEALELARALASRHGLGDLIVALPDTGTGFLVVDVPSPALLEQLDEPTLAQVSTLWWLLVACSEITVAPVAWLLPHLSPTCVLHRALREQDAALLFNAVWTLDPGQLGFRLWRTLSEQDWSDLLALMSCYRALHRMAAATDRGLWEQSA